ncbi:MAG TPA: CdaR family protein, partial [Atribacterota bacterium]|nr:CdaR family protein [Atribacterota bacterium]
MQIIKKWITNNLDIKLLAILMAIILWFYISSQYNTVVEKYYEIEIIPINLEDMLSIREIRERVTVGIKGPQNIVENIAANKITGTVNLQNVTEAGEYLLGVDVTAPKNTQITKLIPEKVRILIEKIVK